MQDHEIVHEHVHVHVHVSRDEYEYKNENEYVGRLLRSLVMYSFSFLFSMSARLWR